MDNEKNVVEEAIKEAIEAANEAAGEANSNEEIVTEESAAEETGEEYLTEQAEDAEMVDAAEADGMSEAAVDAPDTSGDSKEGKFFKKKRKKDKKDEQIEDLTDKLTRQMAEFDNFRKRTVKEKASMYEVGAKEVIEKILPVVDNFERGLAAVPEGEKGNPFIEGMDKIYRQMVTMLEEIGVAPIEAVGSEFNPDLHNAVMHVEDEELGENIVAEEFQKGYKYRDSVIRHSMVKVAN